MQVTIIDRGHDGWGKIFVTLEISDKCPVCGGPRGTPYWHRFHEDGDWYDVQRWDNPCGHIDKYVDVLKENKDKTIPCPKCGAVHAISYPSNLHAYDCFWCDTEIRIPSEWQKTKEAQP